MKENEISNQISKLTLRYSVLIDLIFVLGCALSRFESDKHAMVRVSFHLLNQNTRNATEADSVHCFIRTKD